MITGSCTTGNRQERFKFLDDSSPVRPGDRRIRANRYRHSESWAFVLERMAMAREIDATALNVARTLAGIAKQVVEIFPSQAEIAERSGLCVRTVRSALQRLATMGLIQITPRYTYNRDLRKRVRTSDQYDLVLTKINMAKARVSYAARRALEAGRALKKRLQRIRQDLPAASAEEVSFPIYNKGGNGPRTPQATPAQYAHFLSLPWDEAQTYCKLMGFKF